VNLQDVSSPVTEILVAQNWLLETVPVGLMKDWFPGPEQAAYWVKETIFEEELALQDLELALLYGRPVPPDPFRIYVLK